MRPLRRGQRPESYHGDPAGPPRRSPVETEHDGSVTDERDAYMTAVTVGARRRVDGPIVLADYDRAWPILYEVEAARVRSALGGRGIVREHVGSTSIPGLPAKPIVDMVLAVRDSADEPR